MNFSVIILNWNGRRHLEACLSALAGQTWRDFETILVDNASQDDSIAFVQQQFPWVRLVVLSENRGFSGGNAAGLAVAQGKEIVLLNNDTRPEPDWLERLQQCAAEHPEVGMIASHLTDWEGERTDSAGDDCRISGRGFGRHRGQPAATAPASGPVFGVCGGAALYRRSLIGDVGFLDEDFFLDFEDTDLNFRAQVRGWDAWFCREAVVRHRMSATQGVWTDINTYHGARNHLWVCAKNMPARLLLFYSPAVVVEILMIAVVAARHGQTRAYWRGLGAGLSGLRRMLSKRRSIQAARRRSPGEIARLLRHPEITLLKVRKLLGVKN